MSSQTSTSASTVSGGVASTTQPRIRNTACQRCHTKKSRCSGISSEGCQTCKKGNFECVPQQRDPDKHPDSSFRVNPQAPAEFTASYYGDDSGFAGFRSERPQNLAQETVHSTSGARGSKRGSDESVSKVCPPPGKRPLRVLVSADGTTSQNQWLTPSDDRSALESVSTCPAGHDPAPGTAASDAQLEDQPAQVAQPISKGTEEQFEESIFDFTKFDTDRNAAS